MPKVAFLDPLLTVTCPKSVTVASGVRGRCADAVHRELRRDPRDAGVTPLLKSGLRPGVRCVSEGGPRAGEPRAAGADAAGSVLLGHRADEFAPGAAGALSYPLGVHYRVPHGLAHAVFQPTIIRWSVERKCIVYADLYDLISGATNDLGPMAKSREFSDRLAALYTELDIPQSLAHFGITQKDIQFLAEQAVLLKPAIDFNPIPVSVEEITTILTGMI